MATSQYQEDKGHGVILFEESAGQAVAFILGYEWMRVVDSNVNVEAQILSGSSPYWGDAPEDTIQRRLPRSRRDVGGRGVQERRI